MPITTMRTTTTTWAILPLLPTFEYRIVSLFIPSPFFCVLHLSGSCKLAFACYVLVLSGKRICRIRSSRIYWMPREPLSPGSLLVMLWPLAGIATMPTILPTYKHHRSIIPLQFPLHLPCSCSRPRRSWARPTFAWQDSIQATLYYGSLHAALELLPPPLLPEHWPSDAK